MARRGIITFERGVKGVYPNESLLIQTFQEDNGHGYDDLHLTIHSNGESSSIVVPTKELAKALFYCFSIMERSKAKKSAPEPDTTNWHWDKIGNVLKSDDGKFCIQVSFGTPYVYKLFKKADFVWKPTGIARGSILECQIEAAKLLEPRPVPKPKAKKAKLMWGRPKGATTRSKCGRFYIQKRKSGLYRVYRTDDGLLIGGTLSLKSAKAMAQKTVDNS